MPRENRNPIPKPKDVFVSYSTDDRIVAGKIVQFLEDRDITCWVAPRDVTPGTEFDEAILDAIDQTQAMVVVLSNHANGSPFVKSEVNRAFAKGKSIFTFRIEDVFPVRALELYLARPQWTDGFPPPLEDKVTRLASAIAALLGKDQPMPSNDVYSKSVDPKTSGGEIQPVGELPEELDDDLEGAEAYESIGDVWSAAREYDLLAQRLIAMGNEQLANEMNRRARLNRRAAAQMMRG